MTAWGAIRVALLLTALAPFAYYIIAIIAARRFFGRRRAAPIESENESSDFTPPLSILKPIYGLDRETYENYASFCRQDYPQFELLFCVSDNGDPALPVIQKLIQDFPDRSIRLLIGSDPLGASDKVNKLCRLVREARHEIVIVTDSDVRVDPGYLRAIAAPFRDPAVGGVTCLYRGLTDGGFGADLEAIGNSTDFAAGVLVNWLGGKIDFMLGAMMATTKKYLAEIGGFEAIVDYFCDDFELGNRLAAKGHRVELSTFPVAIVYPHETFAEAFRHQVRWNLSIRYSRPAGHLGLIFTQGLPWTILAVILAPSATIALAYLAAYVVLRSEMARHVGVWAMQDRALRSQKAMLPVRDAFAFVVWLASFFPQRIHWRGKEFYVRDRRLVSATASKR
ncbi:MAG TPA: bacteriohopanetetrol glucosamine biosynthesis glycosyltransferase HpnI [Terriglobales bacterium]|nr:bacteriohopanetetrol glucosamine biosynthesis glycosyltransferase HpnI [Terriglobales bacterium]